MAPSAPRGLSAQMGPPSQRHSLVLQGPIRINPETLLRLAPLAQRALIAIWRGTPRLLRRAEVVRVAG